MSRSLSSLGSLAALATLVASTESHAFVFDASFSNVVLGFGDNFFDLDGNGSDDLNVNVYLNDGLGVLFPVNGSAYTVVENTSQADPLFPGDVVDNSGFYNGFASMEGLLNAEPSIVGVRFWREGELHFGWVAFDFSSGQIEGSTVLFGAWESTPGLGITVGVTAVPEPGHFALIGGLATGLALLVRRRSRRSTEALSSREPQL